MNDIFNIIKNVLIWMHDSWSYFIFVWLSDNAPSFLQIGSFGNWWTTAIQVIFWLGLYAGVAWIYFKVVGYPARKVITHFHIHNTKLITGWQLILYIFIGIYCSTGSTIISIEEKIFDITPVVFYLPVLIYYIIKAKWRFVYFPFLQIVVVIFWIGAIFLFFPVLFILFALSFVGVALEGVFTETRYRCRSCGKVFTSDGLCPSCHQELDAVF